MQPAQQYLSLPKDEGPFRADQIRDGDPYELSNGHPILCMGAGERHGEGNLVGAATLGTDPDVRGAAGVDVGHSFNEGKNLRAPDISVGIEGNQPGWSQKLPPLAVEYADTGQDEKQLQLKIGELLAAGTKYIWVVRLTGPRRVEVYEKGKAKRVVDEDGALSAPGVLKNNYKVAELFDRAAGSRAMLRNLLQQEGYEGLDDLRAQEQARGQAQALLTVLSARGLQVSEEIRQRIEACADLPTLTCWLARAVLAATASAAIE